ncbi:MAG: hypothetical protein ABIJ05_03250 [Patescibacteria group bacterium]
MEVWQQVFLLAYAAINLAIFVKALYECKVKNNAYRLTPALLIFGIIAWGDAVVFGPFWIISSFVAYLLGNWFLFLLIISVFWAVRSIGETIYWLNQQFSSKVYKWNKPENLSLHFVFHNDSIWFIYQICWQCITIISIIFSIYFASLWLSSF